MGKVVKFCNACDEGFAEKFGFCPNCGAQLQAFEMNPLEAKAAEEAKTEPIETVEETPVVETAPVQEVPQETETFSTDISGNEPAETKEFFEFSNDIFEEPAEETKTFETVESSPVESADENLYQATHVQSSDQTLKNQMPHYVSDGAYQPTIVYEKNVKQRNVLLLGAFILGSSMMVFGYLYSMFNKYLDIAAIETPTLLAYVEDLAPPPPVELEQPKKNKDEGGGGGGGGKEEETPASKGRLATQTDNPFIAPDANMDRLTNPELAYRASTKGNRQEKQTDENYGLPNGLAGRSNGTGSGGGLGDGKGRGQGNGNGNGLGNGNGDGSGNGNGNGNGNGTGGGDNEPKFEKPPVNAEPPQPLKILSKPRANYTDAARQNNVQGKVVLRITFSANGTIGGISVVSGLGSGLTEQAIAAARQIKFEPARKNGQAIATVRSIEYSFTIY